MPPIFRVIRKIRAIRVQDFGYTPRMMETLARAAEAVPAPPTPVEARAMERNQRGALAHWRAWAG